MKKKGKIKVGDIVVIRHFHPMDAHHRKDPTQSMWKLNKERFKVMSLVRNNLDLPYFYQRATLKSIDRKFIAYFAVAVSLARAKDTKDDSPS